MYPGYTLTDEEIRELAKNLSDFAFSMAKGNREAFVLAVKVLGGGAILGVAICLLVVLGQSYALGFYPARAIYGLWWASSPLIGLSLPIVLYLFGLIFFNGILFVERLYQATFSEHARQLFDKCGSAFFIVILVVAGVGLPIYAAYDSASKSNKMIAGNEILDL